MKMNKTGEAAGFSIDLDYLDFSILSYLRQNSKTPLKRMARDLGIHPNTLIQRIKKMEKNSVIKKYAACVDYSKAGYDMHVIVMLKVKKGAAGFSQLTELTKIKELKSVYATTGLWDAITICVVKNRQHLLDVIERIGNIPMVLKTSSSIILDCYKDPDSFNPFE